MQTVAVLARILLTAASPVLAAALPDDYLETLWLRFGNRAASIARVSILTNRLVPLAVALTAILANESVDLTARMTGPRVTSYSHVARIAQRASV